MIEAIPEIVSTLLRHWPYYLLIIIYGVFLLPALYLSFISVILYAVTPILMTITILLDLLSVGKLHELLQTGEGIDKFGKIIGNIAYYSSRFIRNIRDDITDNIMNRFPKKAITNPLKIACVQPLQERITRSSVNHHTKLIELYQHIQLGFISGARGGKIESDDGEKREQKVPIYAYFLIPILLIPLTLLIVFEVLISSLFVILASFQLAIFLLSILLANYITSIM